MADRPDSNMTGSALLVAALLTTGALFMLPTAPLTIERPQSGEPVYRTTAFLQDAPARLWQDPFAAGGRLAQKNFGDETRNCHPGGGDKAVATRKDGSSSPPRAATANDALFRSPLDKLHGPAGGEGPLLVAAMVPGSSFYEDGEFRRRARYAVISGLHEEGYEPENAQNIGYFSLLHDDRSCDLPAVVYYEWFLSTEGGRSPVLLLWVDEDALFVGDAAPDDRLKKLQAFVCRGANANSRCNSPMRVVGPYSTGVLERLCTDRPKTADARGPKPPPLPDPLFYAYAATGRVDENKCRAGLVRTIADDAALAKTLAEELGRRGVTPRAGKGGDKIYLLSEHDTAYGRNIREVFACALAGSGCEHCNRASDPITTRSYLRGLDGTLASGENGAAADRKGPDGGSTEKSGGQGAGKGSDASPADANPLERPFGQGQFDYLRRIAAALRAEDERLRREEDGARIAAVGVLGNDVFDKLLLLRALRPSVPEAVFFTTDYDATLGLAAEREFSRNLVIASSYGPTLAKDLQGEAPPFRSVYQASAFVAARLAVRAAVADSLPETDAGAARAGADALGGRIAEARLAPRLFELNRAGVPLSLATKRTGEPPASAFPPPGPFYPEIGIGARIGLAITLAGIGALSLATRHGRTRRARLDVTWLFGSLLVVAAAAIVAAWPFVAGALTGEGLGESIAFASGASAWPLVALRLVGVALACGLIVDAWRELRHNLQDICTTLKLPRLPEEDFACFSSWRALRANLAYRLCDPGRIVHMKAAWRAYQQRERCRLPRLVVYVAAFYLFYFALTKIYGGPHMAIRGDYRFVAELVSDALMFVSLVLVFTVFDATMLCYSLVDLLNARHTIWPPDARRRCRTTLGVADPLVNEWIDLKLVAERTSTISGLVYYPFAILTIDLLSRSATFANVAPSWPIAIAVAVCFAIIFGCAVFLSLAAARARQASLDKVNRQIHRAKARGREADKARAERLDILRSHIEALHAGAFVPLLEQPALRALLFPLTGLGWTALIDSHIIPGL